MRLSRHALALAAIGALTVFTPALFATSPPPPADRGTARDLTGTWTASDGSKLTLDHRSSGDHALSGTLGVTAVKGSAQVGLPLSTGDVYVDFALGAKKERYLASKDRTRLVASSRTLVRAVPAGFVRLRLVTYNIRGIDQRTPQDFQAFAQIVKAQQADIVAFQEIKALAGWFGPILNEARLIAYDAGYDFVYGSDGRSGLLDEGEAILVNPKSPLAPRIVSARVVPLARGLGVDPKKDLSRVALVAEIALAGGKTIQVIDTHTSSSFEASRVVQHAQLLQLSLAPGLLMGDFNAAPSSGCMTDLRAKLLDAWPAANPADPGFTSNPLKPHARIDYVFVARKKGGRALASWTLDAPGPMRGALQGHRSDHFGVASVVDLEVN